MNLPRRITDDHSLDSPRVRFNWGFWDGKLAAEQGWEPFWQKGAHFDPVYEAAYWIGHQHAGQEISSSEPAWQEHQTN